MCALLFAATTLNYMDRQVLGILAPTLQREFRWTDAQYGDVVSWFSLLYAFGFLAAGRWVDRVGVRRGLGFAVVGWSLVAIGHALTRTAGGFALARAALGLTESANFPASVKAVAEWFPKRERALATGIFNAGSNAGAVLAPMIVPWIALTWGWQWAFIMIGALGFVWLAAWIPLYRGPDARAAIADEPADKKKSKRGRLLLALLRDPQLWAMAVARLLTDPVWWFYLYWLPKFLDARYGVTLAQLTLPLVAVYVVSDVGSVCGGWLSGALIRRGLSVNRARSTVMLIMALAVIPAAFAPLAGSLWVTVLIVALAAAAHQAWSANLYTLASDLYPHTAVASVVGTAGFAGAMGGVIFQRLTGRILASNPGDYRPNFAFCALAYLSAWCLIQLLIARPNPIRIDVS